MARDKRIYKYEIMLGAMFSTVELPLGAEVVSFDQIDGRFFIWALVDVTEPNKDYRFFLLVGTGHALPDSTFYEITYIGKVVMGPFVWHAIEVRKNPTFQPTLKSPEAIEFAEPEGSAH